MMSSPEVWATFSLALQHDLHLALPFQLDGSSDWHRVGTLQQLLVQIKNASDCSCWTEISHQKHPLALNFPSCNQV